MGGEILGIEHSDSAGRWQPRDKLGTGGQRAEDGRQNCGFRIADFEIKDWLLITQVGPASVPAKKERLNE